MLHFYKASAQSRETHPVYISTSTYTAGPSTLCKHNLCKPIYFLCKFVVVACCYVLKQASEAEREAMLAVNQAAVNAVQEMANMHQRLEMQQLEKIRDICEAALDDMDSLPEKVKD